MDNEIEKDYEVGFKRPPKASRYKKGQSGNANGRPKLAKALKTDLQEELEEIISISEKGKSKPITKQRAMLKRLTASALNGNIQALKTLLTLIASVIPQKEEVVPELTEEEAKLLEEYYGGTINDRQ